MRREQKQTLLFLFVQNKLGEKKRKLPKGNTALPLSGEFRIPLRCSELPASPSEVKLPVLTISFQLFLKVHAQYSLYFLLGLLVQKELSLRLQSPRGGNNLF